MTIFGHDRHLQKSCFEGVRDENRRRRRHRDERGVSAQSSGKGSRKRTAVFQFGSATLKAPASHEDWERNIGLGQAAMKKMKTELLKPGVKLRTSKSTPCSGPTR